MSDEPESLAEASQQLRDRCIDVFDAAFGRHLRPVVAWLDRHLDCTILSMLALLWILAAVLLVAAVVAVVALLS